MSTEEVNKPVDAKKEQAMLDILKAASVPQKHYETSKHIATDMHNLIRKLKVQN